MIILRPVEVTDSRLTTTNVTEADESEWNSGTAYALAAVVMRTVSGTHSIYSSLQASNTGNIPENDSLTAPVFWARVSATNRWAMFSDQISDQTERADNIAIEITPAALVNGITMFNLSAESVNVTLTDPADGEVYNTDFALTDDSGVNTWYMYFFEPIVRATSLAILDLPPYASAVIAITITDTGNTAKCGLVNMGAQAILGETDYGSGIGIVDYSRKERDTFGNPVVITRNYSKKATYSITTDTAYVATVQQILADLRTTPMSWVGSVELGSTVVYGYYKDFSVILSNPTKSLLSIEVEGLT